MAREWDAEAELRKFKETYNRQTFKTQADAYNKHQYMKQLHEAYDRKEYTRAMVIAELVHIKHWGEQQAKHLVDEVWAKPHNHAINPVYGMTKEQIAIVRSGRPKNEWDEYVESLPPTTTALYR